MRIFFPAAGTSQLDPAGLLSKGFVLEIGLKIALKLAPCS